MDGHQATRIDYIFWLVERVLSTTKNKNKNNYNKILCNKMLHDDVLMKSIFSRKTAKTRQNQSTFILHSRMSTFFRKRKYDNHWKNYAILDLPILARSMNDYFLSKKLEKLNNWKLCYFGFANTSFHRYFMETIWQLLEKLNN